MPFHFVALYETLLGLRKLVFPSPLTAAIFDDLEYPGLFSGYIALGVHQRWIDGDLPLWAPTQDGGMAQITWRPGRFIDWPDTTSAVAITEYRGAGLLMREDDPPLHRRREDIATSAAGAKRLRAYVRTELKKKIPKGVMGASAAEIEQFLRTQGALSEEGARLRIEKEFRSRMPPRSQWRPVLNSLKREDEAAFKPTIGRPRKK